ncbi:ion channel [Croceimicrobium sp.]|uniref:ion channel n=1 Tax=Croceimicrobium sp. TaxID=2828340 RepID=UPI003BADA0F0
MRIYKPQRFFWSFLKQVSPALLIVVTVAVAYVYLMRFVDHGLHWVPYVVVLLAFFKTLYFTFFTFRQVNKSIRLCHSFRQLLSVFGILIVLIIFSFAADYTCLNSADDTAFKGLSASANLGYIGHLFDLTYFSVVTFASVGYGDIAPISIPARLISAIEIGQSFVMVIFGLSNINNIRINAKNQNT